MADFVVLVEERVESDQAELLLLLLPPGVNSQWVELLDLLVQHLVGFGYSQQAAARAQVGDTWDKPAVSQASS